jgi:hypothetical protein
MSWRKARLRDGFVRSEVVCTCGSMVPRPLRFMHICLLVEKKRKDASRDKKTSEFRE